jgi:3'-phosphoadenosine 5'-phosphosulfate (PAPS) 3'-phosphatase
MAEFANPQRLTNLCKITTRACTALSPMVLAFYSAITGETAKLKSDASVFTIADGIVQHLLVDHLFAGSKFAAVVGEEEGSVINIHTPPFNVDDLKVPEEFYGIIDTAKRSLDELSTEIDGQVYNDLTVFIDPIDGTREFSTELGEQCSICIGFSNSVGRPVAGVVFRPITQPPTYAAGALSEGFVDSKLDCPAHLQNPKGLLTSNGGIFSKKLFLDLFVVLYV